MSSERQTGQARVSERVKADVGDCVHAETGYWEPVEWLHE